MPATDGISTLSGRNSRASDVSRATGTSRSVRSPPPPLINSSHPTDSINNAGVMSMLKTSTDTGDIGALSFNKSRLPIMPRPTAQPRRLGHMSRISGSSSYHHPTEGMSNRYASSSAGRRASMTSMQSIPPYVADTQDPTQIDILKVASCDMPSASDHPDWRSYSLTAMQQAARPLSHQRSHGSIKSQGHVPMRGLAPPPLAWSENRQFYAASVRGTRPGFRSPSPAQTEYPHSRSTSPRQNHFLHGSRLPRPPPRTYYIEHGLDHHPDQRRLHSQPTARTTPNSPVSFYNEHHRHHHTREKTQQSKSLYVRQHEYTPTYHHPYGSPTEYGQHAYEPVDLLASHQSVHGQQRRRNPTPVHRQPHANAASSTYHYISRGGRSLRRTETHFTESGPPSSDPPSSGSARSPSGPPTPRDGTPTQLVTDSDFIGPVIAELPDSTSDPNLAAHYFEYAEGAVKSIEENEEDLLRATVPPSGLVQRVKAMLESRATGNTAVKQDTEQLQQDQNQEVPYTPAPGMQDATLHYDVHELPTEISPRATMIQGQTSVELPASPVKTAELEGTIIVPVTKDSDQAPIPLRPTEIHASEKYTRECSPMRDKWVAEQEPQKKAGITPDKPHCHDVSVGVENQGCNQEEDLIANECAASRSKSVISPTGRISVPDYALRFSVPVDITGLDETHSNDPFALDADTITAQNQGSRLTQIVTTSAPSRDTDGSVGTLQKLCSTNRCSTINPVQKQRFDANENLPFPNVDPSQSRDGEAKQEGSRSMPGAFPAEIQPAPTSRTPRIHSKSVQLPKSDASSCCGTANRMSLPTELSQFGDSTFSSSSEAGPDVAVRFSMPVSAPQLVDEEHQKSVAKDISGPTPCDPHEKTQTEPQQQQSDVKDIVFFEDDVAPLHVSKADNSKILARNGNNVPLGESRRLSHKSRPTREKGDQTHRSRDVESIIGLRHSGINSIRNYNDARVSGGDDERDGIDIRNMDRPVTHIAHPPTRLAANRAMQENGNHETTETLTYRDVKGRNRALTDSKDLPSLNFSRTDLFDKLNCALEVGSEKSIELFRRRSFSGIYCPSPQKALSSTASLRERYTSFFNKPDELGIESFTEDRGDGEVPDIADEDAAIETERSGKRDWSVSSDEDNVTDATSNRDTASPKELANVASQINRLSIPSVSALTDRLSRILSGGFQHEPHLVGSDQEIRNTIEDIHQIGNSGDKRRPQTVLSNRTSAGFRTLAERAEEFVRNGHHDSAMLKNNIGINKDLPPLPQSRSTVKCISPTNPPEDKASHLSGSVSAPSDLGTLPAGPPPALIRAKSPETEDEVRQLLPVGQNPISRGKKRSIMISSSLNSRPWNLDENYPWTSNSVAIDLSIPEKSGQRDSLLNEAMRERGTRSLDITQSTLERPSVTVGETTANTTASGIEIGSFDTSLNSGASVTTEQCTGISKQNHKHTPNLIESLTKKMCLSRSEEGGTTRSMPASLVGLCERPHDPGERYPSTGLTPPTALNLDDVRSFFSDDSSENERKNTTRKRRLTGLSKTRNGFKLHSSTSHTQSIDGIQTSEYDAGALNEQARMLGAGSPAYTVDGIGMGRAEFHLKRLGEKLRHL